MRKRLTSLATLLLMGVACSSSTEPKDTSPSGLFETVWSDFDRNYVFFEFGGIDWNAYRAAYADSVASAPSDRRVAELIGAMIGKLNDYHAGIITPYGTFGPPPIPYEHHFSPTVVRQNYVIEPIRTTSTQRIAYAHLNNGIGYIHITSFIGEGWGGEIDVALAALSDVHSMVVDIRDDTGGNEDIGLEVAGRFTDRTRVYKILRSRDGPNHNDFASPVTHSFSARGGRFFEGPVAVITNRFNGSAAEDFLLMMRAIPNVVTVGDTTLGLGSHPADRKLANGWTYRVPDAMQSTPAGFVYQWKGLPPGIPVLWSSDATAAGKDPYLDIAIAKL